MKALSFSVIINTYNRASVLENAIMSALRLRHPNFEIIVVNGPSTDNTHEIIEKYKDLVRVGKCLEANLSMSRNIGIAMARGDICCFMDDDATPEPDWLDQLESAYSDETIGGVGGFTRDHTGVTFQTKVTLCDQYGDGVNYDTFEQANEAMKTNPNLYFSQTGTNSSFRRSVLLEIGGFDEHFVYFLDETDVNFRVQQANYKIVYAPNAEVHHKYAPSHLRTEEKVPKSLYHPARSKSYFAIRNGLLTNSIVDCVDKLVDYQRDINNHNRWYLDNNVVDRKTFDLLEQSITDGIKAGLAAAYTTDKRELLNQEKLNLFSGNFKRVDHTIPRTERLKIAFISQAYPPGDAGGIGMWTETMANEIAARGHEVTVISKSHSGHNTVDFINGVWVHRIVPIWQPLRSQPPLPDLPQIIKDWLYTVEDEVTRVMDRRGLDIVSAPIWDVEGLAVLRAQKVPVVTSLHTTFKLCLPTKLDWLENPEYKKLHVDKIIAAEPILLNESQSILGNSQTIKADIEREYSYCFKDNVEIVPHGVTDLQKLYDTLPPSEKPGLFSPNGKFRILFVGRFEDRKGIPEYLEAIEKIAPYYPKVEFVLVGNNDIVVGGQKHWDSFLSRNKGEKFLRNIKAVGSVSYEDLLRYYNSCDLFVAPSRYESFGLIFAEAMTFSKPCIGTKIGGIQEVVEDGTTGILVPVQDSDSLAAAMKTCIDDKAATKKMGIAGRKRFEQKFTTQKMVDKTLKVYITSAKEHTKTSQSYSICK